MSEANDQCFWLAIFGWEQQQQQVVCLHRQCSVGRYLWCLWRQDIRTVGRVELFWVYPSKAWSCFKHTDTHMCGCCSGWFAGWCDHQQAVCRPLHASLEILCFLPNGLAWYHHDDDDDTDVYDYYYGYGFYIEFSKHFIAVDFYWLCFPHHLHNKIIFMPNCKFPQLLICNLTSFWFYFTGLCSPLRFPHNNAQEESALGSHWYMLYNQELYLFQWSLTLSYK